MSQSSATARSLRRLARYRTTAPTRIESPMTQPTLPPRRRLPHPTRSREPRLNTSDGGRVTRRRARSAPGDNGPVEQNEAIGPGIGERDPCVDLRSERGPKSTKEVHEYGEDE